MTEKISENGTEKQLKHKKRKDEQKKKQRIINSLFLLLLMLGLVFGGIGIWQGWFQADSRLFNLVELDLNAKRMENEVEVDTDNDMIDASFIVGQDVTVDVSDDVVQFYYVNPAESSHDTVISLVVDDKVIAESGRVRPGYGLTEIDGVDIQGLDYGTYDGTLEMVYYNPETGVRGMTTGSVAVKVSIVG